MKTQSAKCMKQYAAMPDVDAREAEYMNQYTPMPDVNSKKKQHMAIPEVKSKRAESM